MGDITSKILLDAKGADRVVQQLRQITEEYKRMAEAAHEATSAFVGGGSGGGSGGGGAGGGGTNPFDRATGAGRGGTSTGTGGYGDAGSDPFFERIKERGKPGNSRVSSLSKSMVGAASEVASGNVVGGISSAMTGVGSLMKVGLPLILAGVALGGLKAGADAYNDKSLRYMNVVNKIGRGLTGSAYDSAVDALEKRDIAMASTGGASYFMPLMQGLVSGGANTATLTETGNVTMASLIENVKKFGTDATALGELVGKLQSGGGGGRSGIIASEYGAIFGSRGTEFVQAVSGMVEGLMTRGFRNGDSIFGMDATKAYIEPLYDLAKFGKATPSGAMKIYNTVESSNASYGMGLNTPEQTAMFMAMRQPGEGYYDTMKRLSDPRNDRDKFKVMQGWSGGRQDNLITIVKKQFPGMSDREAEIYIDTMRGRIKEDSIVRESFGGGTPVTVEPSRRWDAQAAGGAITNVANPLQKVASDLQTFLVKTFVTGLTPTEAFMLARNDSTSGNFGNPQKSVFNDWLTEEAVRKNAAHSSGTPYSRTLFKGTGNAEIDRLLTGLTFSQGLQNPGILGNVAQELGGYAEFFTPGHISSKEESAYYEKNKEAFDTAFNTLKNNAVYAKLITKDNAAMFESSLTRIDKENTDNSAGFFTIAEILAAMLEVLKTPEVVTPPTSTKPSWIP